MIAVTVRYHNILRQRASARQEVIQLPEATDLQAALKSLAQRHGPGLREMLFACDGSISPQLIIFRNGQLVPQGQRDLLLVDGDDLKLFPMTSGG